MGLQLYSYSPPRLDLFDIPRPPSHPNGLPVLFWSQEDQRKYKEEWDMKEVKAGQFRKDNAANFNMWEVTAVGKQKLLARVWRDGEVVQEEARYSIGDFKGAYPVIVDVEGNPVDPEPAGERRCEIDWKPKFAFYDDGTGEYHVHDAVGRDDFTAFEAEDGSRCTVGPHWWVYHEVIKKHEGVVLTRAIIKTVVSKAELESGEFERVSARWVILEAKP